MNTRRRLRALFPGYFDCSYMLAGPPGYHGGRLWLARAMKPYGRIVPASLDQYLNLFVRKPAEQPAA